MNDNGLTDEMLEKEDYQWFCWLLVLFLFIAGAWIVELKVDIHELKYKYPEKIICMENYCIVNKNKYIRESK